MINRIKRSDVIASLVLVATAVFVVVCFNIGFAERPQHVGYNDTGMVPSSTPQHVGFSPREDTHSVGLRLADNVTVTEVWDARG